MFFNQMRDVFLILADRRPMMQFHTVSGMISNIEIKKYTSELK